MDSHAHRSIFSNSILHDALASFPPFPPTTEPHFYTWLLILWTFSAFLLFNILLFIYAPYGRYSDLRHPYLPAIRSDLAWFLQELPSLLVFLACVFLPTNPVTTHRRHDPSYVLVAAIFVAHYVQRVLVYPMLMRSGKKPTSTMVAINAAVWTSVNGYLVGRGLMFFDEDLPEQWWMRGSFVIGAAIWVTGFAINLQSDSILRNLRKPGETGYKIPVGGLFKYVTCPNYFGEILEWVGFMIASNFSPAAIAFALWTPANLIPRAINHHRWYSQRFEGYHRLQRKACIPFVL